MARWFRAASGSGASARPIPRRLVLTIALVCVAVATWLYRPSLALGFELDDYVHLVHIEGGIAETGGPFELFAIALPDARGAMEGDVQGHGLPWWKSADVLIRFFRPLASLTHYADYASFGPDPAAFHASSLALYAGVVALCVLLYARLAAGAGRGGATVLVAGILFAVLREHEGNVVWIAGRYSLVSALLSIATLLAHHRWRETGGRAVRAAALALFGLSLLASEMSVAVLGFLVAHELVIARGPWRDRLRALAPFALLAVGWLALYVALGYGTRGTTSYLSPLTAPGAFLERFAERTGRNGIRLLLPAALDPSFPPGVGWRVLGFPASWDPWTAGMLLACFLLGSLALLSMSDRSVRFALLGSALSLVPLAASDTVPRILLFPSIGVAWALACLVTSGLGRIARPRAPARLAGALFATGALVLLATQWQDALSVRVRMGMRQLRQSGLRERSLALELPSDPSARVILVTVPTPVDAFFGAAVRRVDGRRRPPGGLWAVSMGHGRHVLTRTGQRSFRLAVDSDLPGQRIVPRSFLELSHGNDPLVGGERIDVGVLGIEVVEVDELGVRAVEVSIDRPLDDPDVCLVAWERGGWRCIEPPSPGSTIETVAGIGAVPRSRIVGSRPRASPGPPHREGE